jgi:hypothetical protein
MVPVRRPKFADVDFGFPDRAKQPLYGLISIRDLDHQGPSSEV